MKIRISRAALATIAILGSAAVFGGCESKPEPQPLVPLNKGSEIPPAVAANRAGVPSNNNMAAPPPPPPPPR